jgi:hypothetical protein
MNDIWLIRLFSTLLFFVLLVVFQTVFPRPAWPPRNHDLVDNLVLAAIFAPIMGWYAAKHFK